MRFLLLAICVATGSKKRGVKSASGRAERAGLFATQGIRGGANREVLGRIKDSGDIFFAESDRDWILDGATVHVSMIGFDDGTESYHLLDGEQVQEINPDLTVGANVTLATRLRDNAERSLIGIQKSGPFDFPLKPPSSSCLYLTRLLFVTPT